ncbi:hypothetical protein BS17DRAFT_711921, partial [Gyrodon lividus]
IPYHTSILTGGAWILKLMNKHPDWIKTCLGVSHDIFDALICILEENGLTCSHHRISVTEQLGISALTRYNNKVFLWMI